MEKLVHTTDGRLKVDGSWTDIGRRVRIISSSANGHTGTLISREQCPRRSKFEGLHVLLDEQWGGLACFHAHISHIEPLEDD